MPNNKAILIHAASRLMLEANVLYFDRHRYSMLTEAERRDVESRVSFELDQLTKEFVAKGWLCYWTVLDDVDVPNLQFSQVYDVSSNTYRQFTREELNAGVDVVLARILGSVEGKINRIRLYFEHLQRDFTGIIINDPVSCAQQDRRIVVT